MLWTTAVLFWLEPLLPEKKKIHNFSLNKEIRS